MKFSYYWISVILALAVSLVLTAGAAAAPAPDGPVRRTVTGTVTDVTGNPVIGAGVLVRGTTRGVSTGLDGKFSLEASSSETLVISSIGYETLEVPVGDQTDLHVVLNEDATLLDDVVVIGYGAVRKRDVSTAISSIKADDIENHSISDFRQAMAGRMPGVSVMQVGGDPEGNVMVRVRGIGSATAGNNPLYVIDGVPMDSPTLTPTTSSRWKC